MRKLAIWSTAILVAAGIAGCSGVGPPPRELTADLGGEVESEGPEPPPKELAVDLGGGVTMEFVLIPAGEFLMGEKRRLPFLLGDRRAFADESPVHHVTITKPFYLGKYEVTQEQWEAVVDSPKSGARGNPRNPVEDANWEDCVTFLGKLNAKCAARGVAYGLPTEAQWEYACRAETTTEWSFGNDPGLLGDYAWCQGNSGDTTHPVGQKKPNAWGLFDMHGNVKEWCADWYAEDYYAESPTDDPAGPASGIVRVLRGGSFYSDACSCRCACRFPAAVYSPYRRYAYGNDTGLRVVRTVGP